LGNPKNYQKKIDFISITRKLENTNRIFYQRFGTKPAGFLIADGNLSSKNFSLGI